MKLFGLKNCDSCKKALKEITNAGKNIEFIDIRSDPILPKMIEGWLDQHGDTVLVNRKSTTWRNLSDADRRSSVSVLLQAHPTLIKRPVILADDQSYVGWNASVKSALGIS